MCSLTPHFHRTSPRKNKVESTGGEIELTKPRSSEEMDGTLPRIASFEKHSGGAGWGLIFWTIYQDLSNEGSKIVLSLLELVF